MRVKDFKKRRISLSHPSGMALMRCPIWRRDGDLRICWIDFYIYGYGDKCTVYYIGCFIAFCFTDLFIFIS